MFIQQFDIIELSVCFELIQCMNIIKLVCCLLLVGVAYAWLLCKLQQIAING